MWIEPGHVCLGVAYSVLLHHILMASGVRLILWDIGVIEDTSPFFYIDRGNTSRVQGQFQYDGTRTGKHDRLAGKGNPHRILHIPGLLGRVRAVPYQPVIYLQHQSRMFLQVTPDILPPGNVSACFIQLLQHVFMLLCPYLNLFHPVILPLSIDLAPLL